MGMVWTRGSRTLPVSAVLLAAVIAGVVVNAVHPVIT